MEARQALERFRNEETRTQTIVRVCERVEQATKTPPCLLRSTEHISSSLHHLILPHRSPADVHLTSSIVNNKVCKTSATNRLVVQMYSAMSSRMSAAALISSKMHIDATARRLHRTPRVHNTGRSSIPYFGTRSRPSLTERVATPGIDLCYRISVHWVRW